MAVESTTIAVEDAGGYPGGTGGEADGRSADGGAGDMGTMSVGVEGEGGIVDGVKPVAGLVGLLVATVIGGKVGVVAIDAGIEDGDGAVGAGDVEAVPDMV